MSDEEDYSLYSVNIIPTVRNFVGQKTGKIINEAIWNFSVPSLEIFKEQLWEQVKPHLKHEVLFENETPAWSENDELQLDSLSKFVGFVDERNKRNYSLNMVSENDLVRWRDRNISMNIYSYSNSIVSKSLWTNVEKFLLKPAVVDRIGAAAQSEINELVRQLKEIHLYHYRSTDISWMQWANYIFAKDAHIRETLMREPPPTHLIHLFAHARTDSDNLINQVRQNLNIADRVDNGVTSDVKNLRMCFENLRVEVLHRFEAFDRQLGTLENKLINNEDIITGFQEAVRVEESEFGREEFQNVEYLEDIDHVY